MTGRSVFEISWGLLYFVANGQPQLCPFLLLSIMILIESKVQNQKGFFKVFPSPIRQAMAMHLLTLVL